jgi:hypothetical protein
MGQKVGSNRTTRASPYDRTPEYLYASGAEVFRIPSAAKVCGMRWLVGPGVGMPVRVSMVAAVALDSFLMPQLPVLSLF